MTVSSTGQDEDLVYIRHSVSGLIRNLDLGHSNDKVLNRVQDDGLEFRVTKSHQNRNLEIK